MTNEEAWLFAASWGSYMTSGDPGACLYGFDERFLVQSEQHRTDCVNQMLERRRYVETNQDGYEDNEIEQIDALIEKLKTAEVE